MPKIKVLVTDHFTHESIEFLQQNLECEVVRRSFRKNGPKENNTETQDLKNIDAILTRSRCKIDSQFMEFVPQLKVIITATSGYDHIDLNAAADKNIAVMYTPSANTQSAAELTIYLMLGALRRANEASRLLRDGRWRDELTMGHELKDKNVGIVGLGRVGSRVAEFVQKFGAHVIAYDPFQEDKQFEKLNISRHSLTEVFSQSDILTLHVPLTSETRRLIRQETLQLTKDGLILINTSRGQVIDEGALVSALESKEVLSAGLDVFENEPLARDSKLRKMPQVLLTPHIGAYTDEAFGCASMQATQKLVNFIKKGEITDNLPPQ